MPDKFKGGVKGLTQGLKLGMAIRAQKELEEANKRKLAADQKKVDDALEKAKDENMAAALGAERRLRELGGDPRSMLPRGVVIPPGQFVGDWIRTASRADLLAATELGIAAADERQHKRTLREGKKKTRKADKRAWKTNLATEEGTSAFLAGVPMDKNPHKPRSPQSSAWTAAWRKASQVPAQSEQEELRVEGKVKTKWARPLQNAVGRVHGATESDDPNSLWMSTVLPQARLATTEVQAGKMLETYNQIEGLQLLAVTALKSDLVSKEEKADLKRFIGFAEGDDTFPKVRSKAFTNLTTLKERLDGVGFSSEDLDQMQRNMNRITRLRDEYEGLKKDNPPEMVDDKRVWNEKVKAKQEELSLATALTFSKWEMAEEEGPNGETVYTSRRAGKPYSIQTVPYKNGIGIMYIVNPELERGSEAYKKADAAGRAEAKQKASEGGGNISWMPRTPDEDGPDPAPPDPIKDATDYMNRLNPVEKAKTAAAMKRFREHGKDGLTKDELWLLVQVWPLIKKPDQ